MIVGKALYERRFTVAEGQAALDGPEPPARRGRSSTPVRPDTRLLPLSARVRPGLVHYKRVIPCMDVDAGRVVKGTRFIDIRDAGDPVELAAHYDAEGADELVFLDITATSDKRATVVELARRAADEVFVPFTIGGGVRAVADAQAVLDAGADKVSVNSAAVARPELIDELAQRVRRPVRRAGDRRQARPTAAGRSTWPAGARRPAATRVEWAREGVERGAGEILLTSMDRDGTKDGYDTRRSRARSPSAVDVPVIASGGAGEPAATWSTASQAGADAVLLRLDLPLRPATRSPRSSATSPRRASAMRETSA